MALCFERKFTSMAHDCIEKIHITDSKSGNTYQDTKYYHIDQEI